MLNTPELLTRRTLLAAVIANLTDKNHELDYGFPNPGRMWFANANDRF